MNEPLQNSDEMKIRQICRILLESPEKIIKEKELLKLLENDEELFHELISNVNARFDQIGYELIRTTFLGEVYYLLAGSGMDKNLTPQMYGILGLIFSFQKEFTRDLTISEAREIFKTQLQELQFLQEKGYLKEHTIQKTPYLLITPIGKVLFKDVISDLSLNTILKDLGV
jgi:hypothetical protein